MACRTYKLALLRTARLLLVAGMAVGASGCLHKVFGSSNLPVDSSSPVAQDVIRASKRHGPYPKFSQIPPLPTDVRSSAEWAAVIADTEKSRGVLAAQASALPPVVTDTQGFATSNRAKVPSAAEAPSEQSAAQTEADAQALRARATPPPQPK